MSNAKSTASRTHAAERLMLPEEVAEIYGVDPKTVTRWARAGRIRSTKTPGGQWRIYASEVEAHSDVRVGGEAR